MREESNRGSYSSPNENEQERWRWWLLFCGLGSYEYDRGLATYVVVTGAGELGDLLAEGKREDQRQSLDCVQMNKEELVEQEERKEESEI